MPRPAQRATTPAISSPPAPSTVSRVQFGGLVCPPTSQANQGFARTDAVCPLNRHPEHLANLGLALAADPQIANLPSAPRPRQTPKNRSWPGLIRPAKAARRGRDRRFKARPYLNDRHGKLRCYVRAPRKGTKRSRNHRRAGQEGKDETAMVRSRVLLSAIFATLGKRFRRFQSLDV